MHSVAHGVIRLEELAPEYGAERRRLRVIKYRGQRYRGGYHDFVIETGGVRVFPRLVSAEHKTSFQRDVLQSDSPELNALLGGGVERGSSVLILGPGRHRQVAAGADLRRRGGQARREGGDVRVRRGAGPAVRTRARASASTSQAMVETGQLVDRAGRRGRADARASSSDARARAASSRSGARTVVIDSLNGYQAAMPEEQALILHMHELLQYLNRQGAIDLPHRRAARAGRRHEGAGRRHLSCRHGDPAALFRGARPGAPRDLGHQEADRRARGHDPRISDRQARHHARRAADRLPGRAARRARAGRRQRRPAAGSGRRLDTATSPNAR